MLEKYRNKIKSPAEAAKVVKSGDWVDFGFGNGFPELFDEALAARRDELQDVKIRGGLVYRPIIHTIDCDPDRKHFQYYSWHLGGYERKNVHGGTAPVRSHAPAPAAGNVSGLSPGGCGGSSCIQTG